MKIVLVQLIGRGGTQLYISQLANALSKTGNEVIVLLGSYLFNESHYRDSMVKIIHIDASPSYYQMALRMVNPLTYYHILKIINREKTDIVHAVFEDALLSVTLYLLKRRYPIVITEHDPSFHLGEKLLAKFNWRVARLITRRIADAIIVHGKKLKNILTCKGISSDKIWVIPHGDYSFYKKWKKEIEPEEKSVLFFGSIREYKGLEYLIKAVPAINSSIPGVKIIIAGEGNFAKYETMIENRNHFEIHNRFIPDEEVAEFFQRASVVVLPYTGGSQSGIIPIAYAFKKPVVATAVGAIPEVVDDGVTGVLVPPRDEKALADVIIKLLKDEKLRNEMGENAYKKMKEELSWGKIAEKTIEIYKEVINEYKNKRRKIDDQKVHKTC